MKTNKGFSMVELIIVIAIMAILAGALAPALIKYINKSRISTDIQTANTIATAIQTALANEQGYDAANNATKAAVSGIFNTAGDDFEKTFAATVGGTTAPKTKASKCLKGTALTAGGDFKYTLDKEKSLVTIYAPDGNHVLYPTATECLTNDAVTACKASSGT